MKLFETMRLENGHVARLNYHTQRIQSSSQTLDFQFDLLKWNQLINHITQNYNNGTYRLKITLDEQGNFEYQIRALPSKSVFTAKMKQLDSQTDVTYLTHKTTKRDYLEHDHSTDLILLYDDNHWILEFDIGNIMIKEKRHYFTPRYNGNFLRGCMRQSLIDEGKLKEKNYTVETLKYLLETQQATIYLLNSLREVAEVKIYL